MVGPTGPREAPTLTMPEVVDRLATLHGLPERREPTDPFELILAENVAYLADDERRDAAMRLLRETVGTTPRAILTAQESRLSAAGELGILPEQSADKLRRAAEIAEREFGGNVSAILDLPPADAKRALRRFPGIGEPGAEKILLLCGRGAFLAPDSNALRVLQRLGLSSAEGRYPAQYAAARERAAEALGSDIDRLRLARHVLREHGRTVCRRSRPRCEACPFLGWCPSATPGVDPA